MQQQTEHKIFPFEMSELASSGGSVRAFMTAREKFMFDLNGFIIVKGAISAEEVQAMNAAIDAHMSESRPRNTVPLKNAAPGSAMAASQPRSDLGGMLGWESPHGDMFRNLLVIKEL